MKTIAENILASTTFVLEARDKAKIAGAIHRDSGAIETYYFYMDHSVLFVLDGSMMWAGRGEL